MIDVQSAFLAAISTVSITGIVAGIVNYGEMKEFKKNTTSKVDTNYNLLKDEIEAHENRDNSRHKEIIDRISTTEENIIDVIRRKR